MSSLAPARPDARPSRPHTTLLLVLLVGQFMAVLDVSVVNMAVAAIGHDLHASGAGLQLAVAGYTISYAVLLVTGARLGDRWGHARAFRAGLAGFTVCSLLCGLAPGIGVLVAARVLQGIGAALMMPQVMSLIQRAFAGAERARALSLYAVAISAGAVGGQVLGGILVSADLFGTSWRPVFLVNVPIGAGLLVLAHRSLPRDTGDRGRRIDVLGTVALGLTIVLLVVPLVLGRQLGWPGWCVVALALSPLALAAFVVLERVVESSGRAPLLPRTVLGAPGLLLAAGALLLNLTTYSGYQFAIALHLQYALGESAVHAALVFAPAAVAFAVTGLTWRRLPQRLQAPMVPSGFVVAAAGYLAAGRLLAGGGRAEPALEIVLAVVGLAIGLAFSPLMGRALEHVPVHEAAGASGVLVTVIQLGQLLGVTAFGTLFLSRFHAGARPASGSAIADTLLAVSIAVLAAAAVSAVLVSRRRRS